MKIFLSYAPADQAIAATLYDRLRSDGFSPWCSDRDLTPGSVRKLEIKQSIETSDAVLVLISRALVTGVGSMHKETKQALDLADEQPEGTIFVIPLKIEDYGVPDRLSQITPVDYFEQDGYDQLLKALKTRGDQLKNVSPIRPAEPDLARFVPETITRKVPLTFTTATAAKPKSRWRRWSVALALVLVCLSAAGWFAKRKACSEVTVPASHYVKQQGNKKAIIFVHGVLGDVDNTWVNATTHASWPDLISSDPEMAGFDVYVYGYKSSCGGDTSNINEIADRMEQQLNDDGFFTKYQEIDFITHSMGGLVTKRMLAALNTPAESSKLQVVHTVLFIAVPAAGAPVAALATWFSDNPQFRNMNPTDSEAFLQSIDQGWSGVARERSAAHPYPHYFVAYETGDIASLKIVPALYTSTNSDLPPIAFDYNHSSIVKPSSLEDAVYKWARARILAASN